jgi:hypothetical protein
MGYPITGEASHDHHLDNPCRHRERPAPPVADPGCDRRGRHDLAPILAASGLVYLGAAALRKPAAAWAVFLGTFVVVGVGKAFGEAAVATWVILGLAGALALFGVVRGALRPAYGLPLQSLAMLAFGAVAAVALAVNQSVGAYLVAAGLLGHAAWDVYHHRVNRVVVRSLAEFCFVLDTLLAVVIVVITVRG